MSAYLDAIPEPLYALFGTGYLGYTVAREWGKGRKCARPDVAAPALHPRSSSTTQAAGLSGLVSGTDTATPIRTSDQPIATGLTVRRRCTPKTTPYIAPMSNDHAMPTWHGTTILSVRRGGKVVVDRRRPGLDGPDGHETQRAQSPPPR